MEDGTPTQGMPCIEYTYRQKKSTEVVEWELHKTVVIDQYAQDHWQEWYYFPPASEYYRLCVLRELISCKYDCNFENYVKAMIEHEIMECLICDDTEEEGVRELASLFLTEGWVACEINIEKEN